MIMHHHRCEHGKHTSRVGTPHNSGSRRSPRGISPCLGLATWHLAHKTGQRQSQAAGSGIRLMTNKMAWDKGMCGMCGNDSPMAGARCITATVNMVFYELELEASQLFAEHHVSRGVISTHATHATHMPSSHAIMLVMIYNMHGVIGHLSRSIAGRHRPSPACKADIVSHGAKFQVG